MVVAVTRKEATGSRSACRHSGSTPCSSHVVALRAGRRRGSITLPPGDAGDFGGGLVD
jgi:hypothetical protein